MSKEAHTPEWRSIFKPPFYYDPDGTVILDQVGRMVIEVRGWGHLTGSSALNLPEQEAIKIQDQMGRDIANTLNQWPDLLAEVEALRKENDYLRKHLTEKHGRIDEINANSKASSDAAWAMHKAISQIANDKNASAEELRMMAIASLTDALQKSNNI